MNYNLGASFGKTIRAADFTERFSNITNQPYYQIEI